MSKLLISIWILLFGGTLSAQSYLYIKNAEKGKMERFAMGEYIRIQVKGSEEWSMIQLKNVDSTAIFSDLERIPINDITAVRSTDELLRGLGIFQRYFGVGVAGLTIFNNAINNDTPWISGEQAILFTFIIGSSYFWDWLSRTTYRMEDGWKLEVINFEWVE